MRLPSYRYAKSIVSPLAMRSVRRPEVKVHASSVSSISTCGAVSLRWNCGQCSRSVRKLIRRVVMMSSRGLVTSIVRMPPSSVMPGL